MIDYPCVALALGGLALSSLVVTIAVLRIQNVKSKLLIAEEKNKELTSADRIRRLSDADLQSEVANILGGRPPKT